jgi:hypothetical protein
MRVLHNMPIYDEKVIRGFMLSSSVELHTSERMDFSRTMPLPGDLENRALRRAVRENLVSFPSQVPVFGKQSRPDLQPKLVMLYFVFGWTMDDIAMRYGLGRQRMGQILTAWRIRAVKEGYIQAIEPEQPLFQRVRLEEASRSSEAPVRASPVIACGPKTGPSLRASEVDEPRLAMPDAEFGISSLAEQLHAMVGILDNQLRLCSRPFNGTIDSCEPLLASAKTLCARLEAQISATRTKDGGRTRAAISAAKNLFQCFQESFVPPAPRRARHAAMTA